MTFKKILTILTFLVLGIVASYGAVYNADGNFRVELGELSKSVYNTNIQTEMSFLVTNAKNVSVDMNLLLPNVKGWDVDSKTTFFTLKPFEKKTVTVTFVANSAFDYTSQVNSPDVIKISKRDDYSGSFTFPISMQEVQGEKVTFSVLIEIKKPEFFSENYTIKISKESVSPVSPVRYTVLGDHIPSPEKVQVKVEFAGAVVSNYDETFSAATNYKIFQQEITNTLAPGKYPATITLRLEKAGGAQEWKASEIVEVESYRNVVISQTNSSSLFKQTFFLNLKNNGNIEEKYTQNLDSTWFNQWFFSTNIPYTKNDNGYTFEVVLAKGEGKQLYYAYNFLSLYVVILVLILVLAYVLFRKVSNPLVVDTKVYDIHRVEHEGVKGLKVRIAFENIKEESIDTLKIVFRMPAFLTVKEASFLLVEPNHVLKGHNQYKLVWQFRRFEQNESRILGFTLENSRGVLGDIKIPDLEMEITVNGRVRTYTKAFSQIRG